MSDPAETPSLLELTWMSVRIGSLSFGGGGATFALLYQEFCVRRGVVSEDEFQLLFGISRIVPGMNLLALTVLLGYRVHGFIGSLLTLSGLTLPAFAIIILGCVAFAGGHPNPYVQGVVRGLGPAAAALMAHTGWRLCASALQRLGTVSRALWLMVLATTTVLALFTSLHPGWLVLGGALAGISLTRWTGTTAT